MTEVYLGMPPVNIIKFIEEQQQKNDYMTIEALEDGVNVKIKRTKSTQTGNFQIKLNDSDWKNVSWEDIGNDKEYDLINVVSDKSSMSKGDKLKFRNIDKWSSNIDAFTQLKITSGKAKIYGKLTKSLTSEFAASSQEYKLACMFNSSTSLVDASEFNLKDITLTKACYYNMFYRCTSLTSAPKVLPATTLASYCYQFMFFECKSLTSAPELPATTLADYCYYNMFPRCTSLTSAPKLPATIIAHNCYENMFFGCKSLSSAPELPATTLARGCYWDMFSGCTSLTSAPELPATTLADNCYTQMFFGCSSLTSAPELPATTLADYCYYNMFPGCTSLTSAPELPATELADDCYSYMFSGCAKITELHYPKSIENDSTFKNLDGSPNFGANNATVYYDL